VTVIVGGDPVLVKGGISCQVAVVRVWGLFGKNEAEKESTAKSRTTVELLFRLNNNWIVAKASCLTYLVVGPESAYVVAKVANGDGLCQRGNSSNILPVSSR
jgi:hypothetical protein